MLKVLRIGHAVVMVEARRAAVNLAMLQAPSQARN
jgi:hypothetical protein